MKDPVKQLHPARKPTFTRLIVAGLVMMYGGAAFAQESDIEWSYRGANGPKHWANIDQENLTCADGERQSPINLRKSRQKSARQIKLDWQPGKMVVANDGRKLWVDVPEGSFTHFGDQIYHLERVEFRHRSEHTIGGQRRPMEAQFIHNQVDGKQLIVGVQFTINRHNAALGKIWQVAPRRVFNRVSQRSIELDKLVPLKADYYQYEGSLPFPPCTENVTWVVFDKPISISEKQLKQMKRVFRENYRPLQKANRRKVQFGN